MGGRNKRKVGRGNFILYEKGQRGCGHSHIVTGDHDVHNLRGRDMGVIIVVAACEQV